MQPRTLHRRVAQTARYVAGEFAKNHLGDLSEFLPTVGFDEFYGNLYHLNAGGAGVT